VLSNQVTDQPAVDWQPKRMRLRYAGTCSSCAAALPAGTQAWYDPARHKVRCADCPTTQPQGPQPAVGLEVGLADPVERGVAGNSARREYQRRSDRRIARSEAAFAADAAWRAQVKLDRPLLGRLAAITAKPSRGPEPQHVTAWKGATANKK